MSANATLPAETPLEIYADKTWLQGALITGVAYGAVTTLYPMCFHLLLKQINRENRKTTIGFLVYITALFITGTLTIISCFAMTQLSFVDNRDFPGGPEAYEEVMFSIPIDDIGNVALLMGVWLADALMVWRTYVIYKSFFVPIYVTMAIPCLLWVATFISGIFLASQESAPDASLWITDGINMTLPTMALSLTMNALTTVMILGRLLYFRANAVRRLGAEHARTYTGLASLIVESAFIYFAVFVTMMTTFIIGNPLQNIFVQLVAEVQIIAPFLIIYRVAQGKAWSQDTTNLRTSQPLMGSTAVRLGSTGVGSGVSTGRGTESHIESKFDAFPMGSYIVDDASAV